MSYDYTQSQTLRNIEALLIQRWEAGEAKYGNHIDNMIVPTHITNEQSWAEMALNEALDGVVYCLRALEEQRNHHHLRASASALHTQYSALQQENKELKAQLDEITSKFQEYKQNELLH